MNIPCKDCLTYVMCKERLRNPDTSRYRSYSGIVLLNDTCSIINEYIGNKLINDVGLHTLEESFIEIYGCIFRTSLSYRMRYGPCIDKKGLRHERM
ncbi:MAG: hypothetical protein ACFFG0_03920 [Candidatus Thorarchaeota archaeon]